MRDDQVHRYARHIALAEIGGLGQTAVMVATARLTLREPVPVAEVIAGAYLAAGGVGTIVVANATDGQRAELAAHGPDTHVVVDDGGRDAGGPAREVVLAPRPPWWPSTAGDDVALAFWRGAVAATRWLADEASQ